MNAIVIKTFMYCCLQKINVSFIKKGLFSIHDISPTFVSIDELGANFGYEMNLSWQNLLLLLSLYQTFICLLENKD